MNAQEILESAGITVKQKMTTPTKPGKQPREVWEISGNVKKYEHIIYNLSIKVKKYRGTISCWQNPTEELAKQINNGEAMNFSQQMEHKAQRAEERAEWLEERAAKKTQIAIATHDTAKQISSMIPFGQPILVGHHSEGRHRKDAQRIQSNMNKSIEAGNQADQLNRRAEISRAKAEKNYSLSYLINQIHKEEAEIRSAQRIIEGKVWENGKVYQKYEPKKGKDLEYLKGKIKECHEKIEYWQSLIKAEGGIQYTKESVNVGDWIKLSRSDVNWYRIYKASPKTVSLHYFKHDQGWSNRIKYADIKALASQSQVKTLGKRLNVDFDNECKTQIDLDQF